jgi:hypothetical protein
MFCKSVTKKPYMFRSLFSDHLQGSSFVLSAFTTFRLPVGSRKVVNALSMKDNP